MKNLHVVCASLVGLLALGVSSVASAQEVDPCTPQVDVLTEIDVRHEQRCRAERARQQTTTQVARPAVTAPAPRPVRTPVIATTAPREERRPSIPPLAVPRRRTAPQVAPPVVRPVPPLVARTTQPPIVRDVPVEQARQAVPPLRRPQTASVSVPAAPLALAEEPQTVVRAAPRPFVVPTTSPMAMAPAGDTAGAGRILAQVGRSPTGVAEGDCVMVYNPGDSDSATQSGDGLFENVMARGTRGTRQRVITFPYAVSFSIDDTLVTLLDGRRPRRLTVTNRGPRSLLNPGESACIPIPPVLPGQMGSRVEVPRGEIHYHIWRLFSNGTARQMVSEYSRRGLVGILPFGLAGDYVVSRGQVNGWELRAYGR